MPPLHVCERILKDCSAKLRLITTRFLMGFAEAGIFPGCMFHSSRFAIFHSGL